GVHRRRLRAGSPIGDSSGGQFQIARQTNFQNGAAASSLRGARLAGIKDHHAILDSWTGDGAVCVDDFEVEIGPRMNTDTHGFSFLVLSVLVAAMSRCVHLFL